MKNNFASFRQSAWIITSVSSLALLAACSMWKDNNPFSDKRPEQHVIGGRRPPMLNPHALPASEPQASMQAPVVVQQSAPPAPPAIMAAPAPEPAPHAAVVPGQTAAEANPYDYYDTSGNPVAPKETAKAPEHSQGNFFSRLFGGHSEESAPKTVGARKQFPGNPNYSQDTVAAAPLASGPEASETPAASESAPPHITPLLDTPPQQQQHSAVIETMPVKEAAQPETAAPVRETVKEVKPSQPADMETPVADAQPTDSSDVHVVQSKPGFFERLFDRSSDQESNPESRETPKASTEQGSDGAVADAYADDNVLPTATASTSANNRSQSAPVTAKYDSLPMSDNGTAQESPNEEGGSSWISRYFGGGKAPEATSPAAGALNKDAGENAAAPKLSSVPQVPEQFRKAKDDRESQMEEMQTDHAIAQEEKQNLDSEPSQLQPMTPVAMPKAASMPEPAAPSASNGDAPVLLGHASALPAPELENVPEQAPAPVELKTAEPEHNINELPTTMEQQRQEAVINALPPAPPVPTPLAPPVMAQQPVAPAPAPVAVEQPTPLVPPPAAPQVAAVPATAPAPVTQSVPQAPAVASDDSDQQQQQAATPAAADASALPSPQILQTVKMMPASRYADRERSNQHQGQ